MKIIRVPISQCELWEKNPRGITKKDFERLKKQIQELGVYKPLVACEENGKYIILGGNMRLRALRELGYQEVDISVVDAPSEVEKIKYSLSDNDRAGYYEEEKLAELVYPHIGEFDFDDFKVDIGEAVGLNEIIKEFSPDEEGEDHIDKKEEVINSAFSCDQLKELFKSELCKYSLDFLISIAQTLSRAAYEFNRLCAGYKDGYNISLLFNPHRLETPSISRGGYNPSIKEAWGDIDFFECYARFCVDINNKIPLPSDILRSGMTIGFAGAKAVGEFHPYIARNIYLEYLKGKEDVKILDPCHGWGGRLIGALSTLKKIHYVGIDPAKKTHDGVKKLAEFLLSAKKIKNLGSSVNLICQPFEEAEISGQFDIALTSPPYYDTELYDDDEKQAGKRYKTYEEFVDRFLRTLIKKTMSHLKDDGYFILNVGVTKYPLTDSINDLCREMGYKIRRIEPPMPIGGAGIGMRTNDKEGEIIGEPFFEISK